MRRLFFGSWLVVIAFVFSICWCASCSPIDYVTDSAADKCEAIFEERLPEVEDAVWEICTSFYENVIIPGLSNEMQSLIDQLRAEIAAALDDAENDLMLRLGCVVDDISPLGWNCSMSVICESR